MLLLKRYFGCKSNYLRYQKPKPNLTLPNGSRQCQTMIKHDRRRPGVWIQCKKTVAKDKLKYCSSHNTNYLQK